MLLGIALCAIGVALALGSFVSPKFFKRQETDSAAKERKRYMPVAGEKGEDLGRLEEEWHNRLTYPTGEFNPLWLRAAAIQDSVVQSAVPLGIPLRKLNLANAPRRAGLAPWISFRRS